MTLIAVPVIYYHSVGLKNPHWRKNFLTLDLPYFENHLKYFSKHYKTISLKEYWEILNDVKDPIKRPLIITFDDAYLDNWQYAYPLLKKYGLKGTIFVSPEFVDGRNLIRPNLLDVWNGNADENDLIKWGFLSWEEMRIMEASGVMDIQSHTMSHIKYPVSDKLLDFHHHGADYLYYIANSFPERKAYYIEDTEFENLLPYGYPVFEMQSAVIARQVKINPAFSDYCIDTFRDYDFGNYNFENAFERIKDEYEKYKQNSSLILSTESEEDYKDRIRYEIYESKKIIEQKLNKKVEFLCWPHGDNNESLHRMALEAGYLMTTRGKAQGISKTDPTRIPERMGINFSTWFKKQKTIFKLKAFSGKSPYSEVLKLKRYFVN